MLILKVEDVREKNNLIIKTNSIFVLNNPEF